MKDLQVRMTGPSKKNKHLKNISNHLNHTLNYFPLRTITQALTSIAQILPCYLFPLSLVLWQQSVKIIVFSTTHGKEK